MSLRQFLFFLLNNLKQLQNTAHFIYSLTVRLPLPYNTWNSWNVSVIIFCFYHKKRSFEWVIYPQRACEVIGPFRCGLNVARSGIIGLGPRGCRKSIYYGLPVSLKYGRFVILLTWLIPCVPNIHPFHTIFCKMSFVISYMYSFKSTFQCR